MTDSPPSVDEPQTSYTFQLFRITLTNPSESPLNTPPRLTDENRAQILLDMLLQRPAVTWSKPGSAAHGGDGNTEQGWHVGNPTPVGDRCVMFRFGRVVDRPIERLNAKGDFVDDIEQGARSAYVIINLTWSVVAISKPKDLRVEIGTLARRLTEVLQAQPQMVAREAKVKITSLKDTREFLEQLENAEKIHWISIGFGRPNPADDDADISSPFQSWLEKVQAQEGTITVKNKGDKIDLDKVKPTMNNAAARGQKLQASIRESGSKRPVSISNDSSVVTMQLRTDNLEKDAAEAADRMMLEFRRIRGNTPPRQLPRPPRWPSADSEHTPAPTNEFASTNTRR